MAVLYRCEVKEVLMSELQSFDTRGVHRISNTSSFYDEIQFTMTKGEK